MTTADIITLSITIIYCAFVVCLRLVIGKPEK